MNSLAWPICIIWYKSCKSQQMCYSKELKSNVAQIAIKKSVLMRSHLAHRKNHLFAHFLMILHMVCKKL